MAAGKVRLENCYRYSIMKHADATDLERKIGYTFKKRELLEQALTHSSHAREHGAARGRVDSAEALAARGAALARKSKTMNSLSFWVMPCSDW